MTVDPRVEQLVEELIESGRTPEHVCRDQPELLREVRELWRRLRTFDAQLDLFFPVGGAGSNAATPPSNASTTDLPRIPGYEIETLLGRGGMGVVFRARQVRLNRTVALKMALAGAYANADERARFQREAEAAARLRHAHIVQIHDVGDADGRPYFTMEFIDGGSLAQKLAGTPLPARQAAALLALLADAVDAAHRSGIVHRDLKPANILLTSEGVPKISDFGLARRLDGEAALTCTGVVIGTPSYMAPEQAAGKPLARELTVDIYALGAILYEMLTGRAPFRAETASETIQQVIHQDPVPLSRLNAKVPRDLEIICLKCLQKDARARYATASALAADIRRFEGGEAISARPESLLRRVTRRVRRRPAFWTAVLVSLAATGALLSGAVWVVSDRTARAREIEAENAATDRAAAEDIREMEQWEMKSALVEAKAALDRAKARLGDRGSAELRQRLLRGERDLHLAARLESIRRSGEFYYSARTFAFKNSAVKYVSTFDEFGLARINEAAETVAERARSSNVRETIVAALEDWAACTGEPERRHWLLKIARLSDPYATPWRTRAHDPQVWDDKGALDKLLATAPADPQSVPLLLALEKYMTALGRDPIPFLKRMQIAMPDNTQINFDLGYMLYNKNRKAEAIGYMRAGLVSRPKEPILLNYIASALADTGETDEALQIWRQTLRIEPNYSKNASNYHNLIAQLLHQDKYDEATRYTLDALRDNPDSAMLHNALAECFETAGKLDEAILELQKALQLDPKFSDARHSMRRALIRQCRLTEAHKIWAEALKANPSDETAWDGYAELALFLGNEVEYRRARTHLLTDLASIDDARGAERVGRACLLAPGSTDELTQAAALIDRALAAKKSEYPEWVHPYFQVAKALAEYRLGRMNEALTYLNGDASRILIPAPQLIRAMAVHELGQKDEASKLLAKSMLAFDWRPSAIDNREAMIYHVLRREAEQLIFPNLADLLNGMSPPRNNEERLVQLGIARFTGRTRLCAKLYENAFASDPKLERSFEFPTRYRAACAAALAGCGRGSDAAGIGDIEKRRWRGRALAWLRDELRDRRALVKTKHAATDSTVQILSRWRIDPDLAGVREPRDLEKLEPTERKDWSALWRDLDLVLKGTI